MARLLYVPLWNLLRTVSHRPMRIDLQMECAAISICIARKTVSAFSQYNAPASLESSESKIKISKRFCIVRVAPELGVVLQRGNRETFKVSALTNGAGLQTFSQQSGITSSF